MPLTPSVLCRLRFQHQSVSEITSGLQADDLKKRIHTDKWSIFENVAHLAAYQPAFMRRVDAMLQPETPVFERYVAENDPHFYDCLALSYEELIAKIVAQRAQLIARLEPLSPEELDRRGRHPKFGLFSISRWTDFFLLHEAHHLWTILQLVFSLSQPVGR